MGPSLAVLARRAAQAAGRELRIIAVSRFSDPAAAAWLNAEGVETIACDLLDRAAVASLPDAASVFYLVGLKFGTERNPSLTWAVNTIVPANVSERFAKSRIVVLSTGNVYPLTDVNGPGAAEESDLAPVGEYATAALARERLFEYFSRKDQIPMVILRLNYAVELRYGVLVDIATKVWNGEPITIANGRLNCIWQGDANRLILRALPLAKSPPAVYNLTGPQSWSVRETAECFGALMGRAPRFLGTAAPTALLSNSRRLMSELEPDFMSHETLMELTAHWVMSGRPLLGRPTHFEVRDGRF
jgi:nucleoside-diphosphate-sugar epimerase